MSNLMGKNMKAGIEPISTGAIETAYQHWGGTSDRLGEYFGMKLQSSQYPTEPSIKSAANRQPVE